MNVLCVGTSLGTISLIALGVLPIARIDLKVLTGNSCHIIHSVLSDSLSHLLVTVLESGRLSQIILDTGELGSRHQEVMVVAQKYGQISALMEYLALAIEGITESWQNILIEMDSKLAAYASRVPPGTVAADFLELLMLGTASDELLKFLVHDITEKGLKKLSQSVNLSYTNIQKLFAKHLQPVIRCISYHLADVLGMAACSRRFGFLGLKTEIINHAMLAAGSLCYKTMEAQQVTDYYKTSFATCFRWLHAVILRLSDESSSTESIGEMELRFIADFIVENLDTEDRKHFTLEKVGQYLKDEDLPHPMSKQSKNNQWLKFLEENPWLKDSGLIIPKHENKSLIQEHKALTTAIKDAFLVQPPEVLGSSVRVQWSQWLTSEIEDVNLRVSHYMKGDETYLLIFHEKRPASSVLVLLINKNSNVEAARIKFRNEEFVFLDFQFYNEETVSFLIQDVPNATPIMIQMPWGSISSGLKIQQQSDDFLYQRETLQLHLLNLNGSYERLEHTKAGYIAVSGSRKVASVLSEDRKVIRLFEMEAEEELDEEEIGDSSGGLIKGSDPASG